jgi:outer membrane protein TolC
VAFVLAGVGIGLSISTLSLTLQQAEVARAYFQLRGAQRQRQFTEQSLASAHWLAQRLQAQHEHGLSDPSAGLRQQALVASLQAALPGLRAQKAASLNPLALLCAQPPGTLNSLLVTQQAADLPAQPELPDLQLGLPGDLARTRPDIAAAKAQLHATTAQIGVTVADLYPRVRLGASFGTDSVGTGNFADWGSRQCSLPIFDQGRRRATVTLRELQQQEALVSFHHTVLAAWHEVASAVSSYQAQQQRQQPLQQRLDSATTQLQLDQARLHNGLITDLPVLADTSAALDAQRERSDARTQQYVALVAVIKALGSPVAVH